MLDRRDLMRHAIGLLGASAGLALLEGCAPQAGDRYLSARRLALLDEAAELMIPQTDTAGARAAGVPASFDMMLARWASRDTQRAFDAVLDELDAAARRVHGKGLLELEPAQRLSVLTEFDGAQLQAPLSGATGPARPAGAFAAGDYSRFKELIFTTYYLSEAGATQQLRLEPVPGPWRGDIPVSDVGRAWAY